MKKALLYGIVLTLMVSNCSAAAPVHETAITIPTQGDWTDHGQIFSAGINGEWDKYLNGGFANAVVKKDGVYYLYYQGSNGYDAAEDTVTYRAIGVATSTDGIHFNKYDGNPVLTWFPNGYLEEGAVSSGLALDTSGEFVLNYGANTWAGNGLVSADGRLATSADGLNFSDRGIVLEHTNRSIWGFGDELFPIASIADGGRWYVYYIPNGVQQTGKLGVSWGNERDRLSNSSPVRSAGRNISVWGPGSAVKIGPQVYALFLNNIRVSAGPTVEVRTVSLANPDTISAPVQTYRFSEGSFASVLLDQEKSLWYMYYQTEEGYGVRTAPAGSVSNAPAHRQLLPLLVKSGK